MNVKIPSKIAISNLAIVELAAKRIPNAMLIN